jgi:predicted helicase
MKKHETHLLSILENNDVKSWQDLETHLSQLEPHISGKLFESFCKYYYLSEPSVKDDYEHIYYQNEIPTEIKIKLNLLNKDYGIDLVLQGFNNILVAVQCKFRKDKTQTLNWGGSDKLAHFIADSEKADLRIIFTNAYNVDKNVLNKERVSLVNNSFLQEISQETLSIIKQKLQGRPNINSAKANPYKFQEDAVLACAFGLETAKRGQLIMPCGTGKTLVGLWIKEFIGAKTTLVAVPSLWLLRQTKDSWANNKKIMYSYASP